ncbi:hypothetical protein SAMN02745133_03149 [Desulforamulus putei DSM 12395]|uniref:Uncharacterized protein n=1 Tax=Desulforamulus putei DSM 12395 TaxID=1121429 RepID=A0A1M5DAN5_9FIRM|nr:hypothetical protein SAMN02745133_03149 [Desulforamulus putei DSM 12395]
MFFKEVFAIGVRLAGWLALICNSIVLMIMVGGIFKHLLQKKTTILVMLLMGGVTAVIFYENYYLWSVLRKN